MHLRGVSHFVSIMIACIVVLAAASIAYMYVMSKTPRVKVESIECQKFGENIICRVKFSAPVKQIDWVDVAGVKVRCGSEGCEFLPSREWYPAGLLYITYTTPDGKVYTSVLGFVYSDRGEARVWCGATSTKHGRIGKFRYATGVYSGEPNLCAVVYSNGERPYVMWTRIPVEQLDPATDTSPDKKNLELTPSSTPPAPLIDASDVLISGTSYGLPPVATAIYSGYTVTIAKNDLRDIPTILVNTSHVGRPVKHEKLFTVLSRLPGGAPTTLGAPFVYASGYNAYFIGYAVKPVVLSVSKGPAEGMVTITVPLFNPPPAIGVRVTCKGGFAEAHIPLAQYIGDVIG